MRKYQSGKSIYGHRVSNATVQVQWSGYEYLHLSNCTAKSWTWAKPERSEDTISSVVMVSISYKHMRFDHVYFDMILLSSIIGICKLTRSECDHLGYNCNNSPHMARPKRSFPSVPTQTLIRIIVRSCDN